MEKEFSCLMKGESLEKLKKFINIYFDNFKSVLKTFKNGKCFYNEYIRNQFVNNWIDFINEKSEGETFFLYDETLIGFMNVIRLSESVQIRIYYFENKKDLELAIEFVKRRYGVETVYVSVPYGFDESFLLKGYKVECEYILKDSNIYKITSLDNELKLKL